MDLWRWNITYDDIAIGNENTVIVILRHRCISLIIKTRRNMYTMRPEALKEATKRKDILPVCLSILTTVEPGD